MYQVLAPHGWRQYREGIESDEAVALQRQGPRCAGPVQLYQQ